MGQEEIDTGIGRLAAVHLAQLAPSGERRVELWLAPQQHWLPVRIQVTEPDGTVVDQVVRTLDLEAPASGAQ
ncbi:DUF3108 domain-containing protein [Massilia sp. Dwa41.01b]|uniref:DUF3108 domain-containing protein n=1 Tax=Massilia sp. Dwa41.01b TaxID=2709302 RepID=UPI001600AD33|nr:DUF3108 domain-containing protein [Massilia sp. Dwa41.01b]QNA89383.1 DUF3108 domain-containing protein [Massilia sp. Dwa41.01b]